MQKLNTNDKSDYHAASPSLPDATRRVLRGPLAPVNNFLNLIEENSIEFYKENKPYIKSTLFVLCLIGYMIYFVFALTNDFDEAKDLLYVTVFGAVCLIYWFFKKHYGRPIWKNVLKPIKNQLKKVWKFIKW